jgi:sensor histidine kinase regulating citrate/malate metabolism
LNAVIFLYYDVLVSSYELRYSRDISVIQLENQTKYYSMVQAHQESISAMDHDMKKHIAVLKTMVENSRHDEAAEYISAFADTISDNAGLVFTPNPVVSAILSNCLQRAKECGAVVKFDIAIPEKLTVNSADITVILGNSIDNALEALENVADVSERKLSVTLKQRKNFLLYEVTNAYDPSSPKRRKPGKHGYGLQNIKACVHKYNGEFSALADDNSFFVSIILNTPVDEG